MNNLSAQHIGTLYTTWDVIWNDVQGNADDGYEINDTRFVGTVSLQADVTRHNVGTLEDYESATLSDVQIASVFNLDRDDVRWQGDDMCIHVTRVSDGFPVGTLECTSHASLSPITNLIDVEQYDEEDC